MNIVGVRTTTPNTWKYANIEANSIIRELRRQNYVVVSVTPYTGQGVVAYAIAYAHPSNDV